MEKTSFEIVRERIHSLLEQGISGKIEGPKSNVLVCDTLEDFANASSMMVKAGFDVASPGGYGGAQPMSRQKTHDRIWRQGNLCAIQVADDKRYTFLFFEKVEKQLYLLCVDEKQ